MNGTEHRTNRAPASPLPRRKAHRHFCPGRGPVRRRTPRLRRQATLRTGPARIDVAAPHPPTSSQGRRTNQRHLPRRPIHPTPRTPRTGQSHHRRRALHPRRRLPRPPRRRHLPRARPRLVRPARPRPARPPTRPPNRSPRLHRHHRAPPPEPPPDEPPRLRSSFTSAHHAPSAAPRSPVPADAHSPGPAGRGQTPPRGRAGPSSPGSPRCQRLCRVPGHLSD